MPTQKSPLALAIGICALLPGHALGQSAFQSSPGHQIDETVTSRFTSGASILGPCGSGSLVLTTHTDPDWVIATSEAWLDDAGCVLNSDCGYEFALIDNAAIPCRVEQHRFFKLVDGQSRSGVINGYDAVLREGFATYDSLFVRAGTTIQLYGPKDPTSPFGEEYQEYGDTITGPVMITIDLQNWDEACHPAVSGDFNLPDFYDGPDQIVFGQMALWPFSIGEAAEVLSVDTSVFVEDNAETNHTSGFVEAQVSKLIVRRNSTFDVDVRLSEGFPDTLPLDEPCEDLRLIAKDTINDIEYSIPRVDTLNTTQWAFEIANIAVDPADNSRVVTCRVHISRTAPIGEYEFRPVLVFEDADGYEFVIDEGVVFPEPVVILFNPWGADPDVSFADQAALDSNYISGSVMTYYRPTGAVPDPKTWSTDQFNESSVDFLLQMIAEQEPPNTRASAQLVASHLAEQMSTAGGGAMVLRGIWATPADLDANGGDEEQWLNTLCGPTTNCTSPFDWKGSSEIIDKYLASGGPVEYGQCWAFAGVLATALRTAGIPTRLITNARSGVERTTPFNAQLDLYYSLEIQGGQPFQGPMIIDGANRSDAYWSYHVWSEIWIKSGGGLPTWHAIDATPYEYNPGSTRAVVGPVPVSSLPTAVPGQSFDRDVFLAAVQADMLFWQATVVPDGDFVQNRTLLNNENTIGSFIATHPANGFAHESVQDSYKSAGNPLPGSASGDMNVAFLFPPVVRVDEDAQLPVFLENTSSEPRTVTIRVGAGMFGAPGLHGEIYSEYQEVTVPALSSVTETFVMQESIVRMGGNQTLGVYLDGQIHVAETDQHEWEPQLPIGIISEIVTASMSVTSTGHPAALDIEYENLNEFDASEVELTVYLPSGMTILGNSVHEETTGTVVSGGSKSWSLDADAVQSGEYEVNVFVRRAGALAHHASTTVTVVDCPADLAEPYGVLDFTDVTAFLTAYDAQDPVADFAETFGEFNFDDVLAFLTSYGSGCFE